VDGIWSLWRVAIVTAAWGAFFTAYGRGVLVVAGAAVLAMSLGGLAACLVRQRRTAKPPPA